MQHCDRQYTCIFYHNFIIKFEWINIIYFQKQYWCFLLVHMNPGSRVFDLCWRISLKLVSSPDQLVTQTYLPNLRANYSVYCVVQAERFYVSVWLYKKISHICKYKRFVLHILLSLLCFGGYWLFNQQIFPKSDNGMYNSYIDQKDSRPASDQEESRLASDVDEARPADDEKEPAPASGSLVRWKSWHPRVRALYASNPKYLRPPDPGYGDAVRQLWNSQGTPTRGPGVVGLTFWCRPSLI